MDPTADTLALGMADHKAGRLNLAEQHYLAVLDKQPGHAECLRLLGLIEQQRGRHPVAIARLRASLASQPTAAAWTALAASQRVLGDWPDALKSVDQALALQATRADSHWLRAQLLSALNRHAQALAACEQVLALQPGHHGALVSRGNALSRLRRPAEALDSYDQALRLAPQAVEVLNNRGSALRDLKRYGDAARAFAQLAALRPDYPYVRSNRLHSQLYACDWSDYESQVAQIVAAVEAGAAADVPFSFLAICDAGATQLQCARRYCADRYPPQAPLDTARAAPGSKLRIGYFSADFHEHATCYLMAGLFEAQDREGFEWFALSHGPDADDPMRRRLLPCFDHFVDLRQKGDREAAEWIRAAGIDILVDLNGFTTGNRAGVLAYRPAPLQVGFLGYPGSMGADYIDYLLADAVVAPAAKQADYSEKLLHLPGSYQVNDRKRQLPEFAPGRSELGLPEQGFVFCCFNNNYKISPRVFALWMRLLLATPGSVLWLLEDNADAGQNLRAEARRAGVAPERLVFAPRLPLAQHLARQLRADLFLDTLPCNAHTTASDALWVGLPVLTCAGDAFASRVAASLVCAAGLPELACRNLEEYEAMALALARDTARLDALRARLHDGRFAMPLFDTQAFARHLEIAYLAIWDRHHRGEPPTPWTVPAS